MPMRIAVAVGGGVLEDLPATPEWSARRLHAFVAEASRARLGKPMRVLLFLPTGAAMPATDVPLASLGLHGESVVGCSLEAVVQVASCEPSVGPDAGGTMVRLHGDGFSEASFGPASNARIGFGPLHSVPCWRISDTMLGCRAPAHAPATVRVRLLGCAAGNVNGPDSDADADADADADGTAVFEFVRLEAMYDAIFNSTNSYCPIKRGGDGGVWTDGQERSGCDDDGDSALNENDLPPPPRFGF